jgi:hypothetical protein
MGRFWLVIGGLGIKVRGEKRRGQKKSAGVQNCDEPTVILLCARKMVHDRWLCKDVKQGRDEKGRGQEKRAGGVEVRRGGMHCVNRVDV